MNRFLRYLPYLVVMVLVLWGVFLFVGHALYSLNFKFGLDYVEGYLLQDVINLSKSGLKSLYPHSFNSAPYLPTAYPPFYQFLLIPFFLVFGPAYWYGRVISLLCILIIALEIALLIKHFTRHTFAAVVGGLSFLTIPYVSYWSPLFRVDQLGLALSVSGLVLIIIRYKNHRSFMLGLLLMILATLTKQSFIIVAPLTGIFWLWQQKAHQKALFFMFSYVLATLLISFFLNIYTAGGFFFNLVTLNRKMEFELSRLTDTYYGIKNEMPYYLVFTGIFWGYIVFTKTKKLCWAGTYLILSIISASAIGKIGSHVNYLLELMVAFSIILGLVVALTDKSREWKFVILLLLAVQLYKLNTWTFLTNTQRWIISQGSRFEKLIELDKVINGPILLDDYYVSLAPLLGKEQPIELFAMNQMRKMGLWDQKEFVETIANKKYGIILVEKKINDRWTPEMLDAITNNYQIKEEFSNAWVYIPKYQE